MMCVMRLTTTAFQPGGAIRARFTCDGEDVSPDLAWEGVPGEAAALVLIVDDPDARDFVHWIVLDMTSSDTGALPAGLSASPDGPRQGINDFGRSGWGGPCPPSGRHRYRFTLFALAGPLNLPGEPRGPEVRRALATAQVLARATLEGSYARRR